MLGAAIASFGCVPRPESSAVRTVAGADAYRGPVYVSVMTAPPEAVQVAMVEAHGTSTELSAVVEEFARRVASSGGNFGKIDRMSVRFELMPVRDNRGNVTYVEVGTTLLQGRALRYAVSP